MKIDVYAFNQLSEKYYSMAGGKGGTLAKLTQAGFPVPEGFVILPSAFDGDGLKPGVWDQVKEQMACLRRIRNGNSSFAVRSSALAEDSSQASFAGEFESILNVQNESDVSNAICSVRSSRHEERVQVYSQTQGIHVGHDMAVVVQRMIHSEISGVLFTADPVTGDRGVMLGNFVLGLGAKLVSGEVNAKSFIIRRPKGNYEGPKDIKRFARKLFNLARRLEKTLGCPQDIEWAIAGGRLYLLQSRPITTLISHNPATGEWNSTLTGDFLWTNTNFGEAVTEPMTPLAWSVLLFALEDWVMVPGFSTTGNIGGLPYLNISLISSVFKALGRSRQDLLNNLEGTLFMQLPDEMEIPHIPLSFKEVLDSIRNFIRVQGKQKLGLKRLPTYLANNQIWFDHIVAKLQGEKNKQGLQKLWIDEIKPHIKRGAWIVLGTAAHSSDYTVKLRRDLTRLVGSDDANILIANVNHDSQLLPSLGPVVGLVKVTNGEMTRADYLRQYGHRGPHEFEISIPRPVEDPTWIDQQLALLADAPIEVEVLFEKQREIFDAAMARLVSQYPKKFKAIHRRIEESARRARLREYVRSEYIRDRWLVRLFACRAGELLGLDDEIFYLSLDELLNALSGDEVAFEFISARMDTHDRYKSLPSLPPIIRGRFDPFQWSADPHKRSDIFDARLNLPIAEIRSAPVTGCPGSSGQIEGFVRVIHNPEDGHLLQNGEILVTVQTDISWTLLFPRARGIITDVGAPLSHAAIVARELGIPAVVGCGNATMRLKTGDRVRVDGGQGVVHILR